MKPRELIIEFINDCLSTPLSTSGFKFAKSKMAFARGDKIFRHEIRFCLNKYNQEDVSADFRLEFYVTSKFYADWHFSQYGQKPHSDIAWGIQDGQLQQWKYHEKSRANGGHFDVIHPDKRTEIAALLLQNMTNIIFPLFEKYSNWASAAEFWRNDYFNKYSKAIDFLVLGGNQDEALHLLKNQLTELENTAEKSFFTQAVLADVKIRLDKYLT